MVPVYQTKHGPDGNCYEACLASVLEVAIESVPELHGWDDVRRWLASLNHRLVFGRSDGWSIASQKTIRGIHAVVCLDGVMVHDPSPRPFGRQGNPVVLWTKIEAIYDDSSL